MTLPVRSLYEISQGEDYIYILDLDAMTVFVRYFKKLWEDFFPKINFAYSYKSNNISTVTQLMLREGFSAEVVSFHELKLAINDGFIGGDIYFDGPVKMDDEIEFSIKKGVNIQCDNILELERVLNISDEIGLVPNISLRLSCDYRGLGLSRFGFDKYECREAVELLNSYNISCNGIHIHSGSNLVLCQGVINTLEYFKDEINLIKDHLNFIDIGGGYPASTCGHDNVELLKNYPIKIASLLQELGINSDVISLVLEPGRVLTEDFGYLITNMISVKDRYSSNLITAAVPGTNIRSSQCHHNRKVFIIPERLGNCEHSFADVYGSNCYENDIIAKNVVVPFDLTLDDKIVISSCGAYDIMNSSNWIRKRPSIMVICKGVVCYENYRFAE
ncbi:diaminopimelate decarboxylase [Pantoea cypripedii]|uniref:Diaminopimelate decarboxylase n=1 Tax=Pantoea cypripedii TaxID=55209 RepID=A0A6B9G5K8_PANCY|nr:diaminopimelate decarboxylase [Pantoea cypripedii]QGY30390.1 diaminopimelate decarboxylase [Pantoea cypripedii]